VKAGLNIEKRKIILFRETVKLTEHDLKTIDFLPPVKLKDRLKHNHFNFTTN